MTIHTIHQFGGIAGLSDARKLALLAAFVDQEVAAAPELADRLWAFAREKMIGGAA